jgi:hypothetical protein
VHRILLAILAAALAVAAGAAQRANPAATTAADDFRTLMQRIREIHPSPFHATPSLRSRRPPTTWPSARRRFRPTGCSSS